MTEVSPPMASPCRKVCAVDGRVNLCIGCGRTLKEIGGWTRMSDAERAAIMAALPERLARAGIEAGSTPA
jgi:uncharacterized protein